MHNIINIFIYRVPKFFLKYSNFEYFYVYPRFDYSMNNFKKE